MKLERGPSFRPTQQSTCGHNLSIVKTPQLAHIPIIGRPFRDKDLLTSLNLEISWILS